MFALLSSFWLNTSLSNADDTSLNIPNTLDTDIRFAIQLWPFTENNSGIEVDILKEVLSFSGYQVRPIHYRLAFKSEKVRNVFNSEN